MQSEIFIINQEMMHIKKIFSSVIELIPSFNITNHKILPYGLKAHTRSISWIVEQVITQQAKFNSSIIGVDNVDFIMPDTCLHDCIVEKDNNKYFINIKIHNVQGKNNKNDISAVEKLYMQYMANKNYRLIYICCRNEFLQLLRENSKSIFLD